MSDELIKMEEDWLRYMIDQVARDDDSIAECLQKAQDCIWWYEQDGDESHLSKAEAYTTLAKSFKDNKYTIKQIREQRERVQWVKTQRRTTTD